MNIKACALFHILVLTGALAMGGPLKVGFSTATYSVVEEDASATITVQLTKTTNKTVTVDYVSSDGTATGGADYSLVSGTLSFAPGQTSETFTVPVIDESEAELDETVNLTLSNPSSGQMGTSVAVLTILDPVDGDPQQPPEAQISAPEDQSTFVVDDLITMDGSISTVPAGFQVWFAALDANSGPPMNVVYEGSTLSESFAAVAGIDAYIIRLVIADPAAMPGDAELRGDALPCEGDALCDATEVSIQRFLPPALHSFELVHAFPEVVLVRWDDPADPSVERSVDGGQIWNEILGSTPLGTHHLRDDTVVAGTSVHYRMKGSGETEWVYLGGTSASPGQAVSIPDWTAPRVIPDLLPGSSFVEWDTTPGGEVFGSTGILSLLLKPEPGESLSECTIKVYLNEETFQVLDGKGEDSYQAGSGAGRDEPGCVVRKGAPDVTITVPLNESEITIEIPGVVYGANSLRFEVTDPFGGFSERALLVPLHGTFVPPGETYRHAPFSVFLYGEDLGISNPVVHGYGPVSRRSPDCRDIDPAYGVTLVRYYQAVPVGDMETYNTSTDGDGFWELATAKIPRGTTTIRHYSLGGPGLVGRKILDQSGEMIVDQRLVVGNISRRFYTPITYDRVSKNPAPVLDSIPVTVFAQAWEGIGDALVRFRISDSYHDVDQTSVYLTNESLQTPVMVRATYSEYQDDSPVLGWMVARIPMEVDASTTLRFEAQDFSGKSFNETRVVNAIVSPPEAIITSPTDGGKILAGDQVVMDGSSSVVPQGSFVWFAALDQDSGDPMTEIYAQSGLDGQFVFPEGLDNIVIRLVISEPGAAPTDVELRGLALPCEGAPTCAASEVVISRQNVEAIIDAPLDDSVYLPGQPVLIDGSGSHVPAGYTIWLGALTDNGTYPMDAEFIDSTLQGSFIPPEGINNYIVRLVIAADGFMPLDDDLRGQYLPCEGSEYCDSAEITLVPSWDLEEVYSFPNVTLLRWGRTLIPYIENSIPPTSPNWKEPECAEFGDLYLLDQDYYCNLNGTAYQSGSYYRITRGLATGGPAPGFEYEYLGGGSSPGDPITPPFWSGPQVLPHLEAGLGSSIQWDIPEGATPFQGTGALQLKISGQEGVSLAGTQIELFLDEDTFQIQNGLGEEIPYLGGHFEQPACMVPKATADFVIQVPADQDDVTVEIPGLTYGAHSFRFKVGVGGSYERAILAPIHESLPEIGSAYTFTELLPVLFGTDFGNLNPVLTGMGPAGRRSPDCGGYDQNLSPERIDSGALYFTDILITRQGAPEPEVSQVSTDQNGAWSLALGTFAAGDTFDISTSGVGSSFVGRTAYKPGGFPDYGLIPVANFKRSMQSSGPIAAGAFQIVESATNPPPTLDQTATIYIYPMPDQATPEEITKRLDFRITDSHHDVDLESVTVTNLSLDPPVTVRGYYAAEQLKPEANWGWMVASLPFIAPGDNQIEISATDSGGNTLLETITITPSEPDVIADIASPTDGSSWPSKTYIPLDGTTSIGPPGIESRWVFFSGDDGSSLPDLEQSGLNAEIQMPDRIGSLKARLVVAAAGHLPADLYTISLPCSIAAGDGQCDSVEINLDNSCCDSSTQCLVDTVPPVTVTASPGALYGMPLNEPIHLEATATGGAGTIVYRWWIAPADDQTATIPLTPQGADGSDYDPSFATWDFDPQSLGVTGGSYYATVEAGYFDEGCFVGTDTDWLPVQLIQVLSAVAPGQVFPGDDVRVYIETISPGEDVFVRIADDPVQQNIAYELTATATDGPWVEVQLPGDIPEGIIYYVSVASSVSTDQSTWKRILEVVHPGYDDPGIDDPSCGAGGQEAANPIVPGQVVTGDFCGAGDTDYFVFSAAAGTTFDVFLERADQSSPVFLPSVPDPELFIVDPQGLVNADYGYADDISGTNPDAVIVGFVAPKSGLYALACKTSKGWGGYSITLSRTSTPNSAGFNVVPYGPRSITVAEHDGEPLPTVSLQAMIFDPAGIPTAGASIDWLLQNGTAPDQSVIMSNGWGIGQGDFVQPTITFAELLPSFDYPTAKAVSATTPIAVPIPGAIAGTVMMDENAVILESRLLGKAEISKLKAASERAQRLAGDSGQLPEKILSLCPDPEALKQVLVSASNPCGATFLSGIQLDILDDLGNPIDLPITDIPVTERETFQASLMGTCDDGFGSLTDIAVAGATVVLEVVDLEPTYTRGIVTSGTPCPTGFITSSGGPEPFDLELGTRSIYTGLDVNGEPEFAPIEMLLGKTRVVAMNSSGSWSTWTATTSEDLAPEPGEPFSINWIHDPFLVIPTNTTGFTEYSPGQNAFNQHGPVFLLLDQFENVVVQWGKDDTQWHRDAQFDQVFVPDSGTEGTPPWAGIDFVPQVNPVFYNAIQFTSAFFSGTPSSNGSIYGSTTWEVCVKTVEHGTICSPWGIDNSNALNWVYTLWPFISNESASPYGEEYVSTDDWFNLAGATTRPGKPLRFAISGKPVVYRIDPMRSDDLGQPHDQYFTDVPVTIWVNGPNNAPSKIRWTRSDPAADFEPFKVEDVEISTGRLIGLGGPELGMVWEDVFEGPEASLTAFTDPIDLSIYLDPGEALGAAFSITKAPSEPGWYTIVVETDDPRFPEYAQYDKSWTTLQGFSVHSFLVEPEPEPDNSCTNGCEECAAGSINLGTGNTHFRDGDPIAGVPEFLTSRAHDSMSTNDGFYGQGWISALDAKIGTQTGGAKSGGGTDPVDITTETGHKLRFVTTDGINFLQTRPAGKVRNTLTLEGGYYVLSLEGDAFDRSFNATSGWLTSFEHGATGRTFTINRDGFGTPLDITDSWKGVIADFVTAGGHVSEITTPTQTFGFNYNGDMTLSNVTLDSVTTRSYTYAGDAQLTEITDGAGRTLESHGFSSGAAASVISASKDVTGVEWGATGPRATLADEIIARVDKASGSSTYYYQRWIGDRYRITEIRGDCDCSGNDRVYGYDDSGKRTLEQDARGYISRFTYTTDGRKTSDERGLRRANCDPAMYPDPIACRLNPEELSALTEIDLVESEAFTSRTYTYGDSNWPNKPTTICSPSVFSDGFPSRTSCTDITFDSATGEWLTRTESGWTGTSAANAALQSTTSSRIFYDGTSTPAFDPGGNYSAAWLSLGQPSGLLRSMDGPRTDVSDVIEYVYYPTDATVPTDARGRLAAVKDALGYITHYEDYDEWGNAQRVIDPNGVINDRTFDAVGRTLTSTVVANGGCDPVVDPLCTTDLTTIYTYQPGYGSLESVTSPGGSVSVTSYDAYGRVLTTGRGPSLGEIAEQTEAEYDPTTLQKTRDSRLASDGLGGWIEHSRTTFGYHTNGHLQTRFLPRSATDPAPAEEHYT
ncbi:MAG: hypothetical protein DRJ65_05495, partial [Acidobacteria bacterium]